MFYVNTCINDLKFDFLCIGGGSTIQNSPTWRHNELKRASHRASCIEGSNLASVKFSVFCRTKTCSFSALLHDKKMQVAMAMLTFFHFVKHKK
jgi:hypothetical protein